MVQSYSLIVIGEFKEPQHIAYFMLQFEIKVANK